MISKGIHYNKIQYNLFSFTCMVYSICIIYNRDNLRSMGDLLKAAIRLSLMHRQGATEQFPCLCGGNMYRLLRHDSQPGNR